MRTDPAGRLRPPHRSFPGGRRRPGDTYESKGVNPSVSDPAASAKQPRGAGVTRFTYGIPLWVWLTALLVWPIPVAGHWAWPDAFSADPMLEDVWGLYLLPAVLLTYYGTLAALLPLSLAQLGAALALMPFRGQERIHAVTMLILVQVAATITAFLADKIRRTQETLVARHRELDEMAYRDGLTSLRNHRYCMERLEAELERIRREGGYLSLLFCDLNSFKEVNDNFGHAHGDRVLAQFANQFQGALRECDILCRYGGDEFVAILPGTTAEAARKLAARLRQVAVPCEGDPSRMVTASIGVASYPEDGATPDTLLRAADHAMYRGKGNPGLAPVREDGGVGEILRRGAVAAWLQPIVHLRTGAILGYEALARGPEGTPFFEARELFRAAGGAGLADDLELLCRRRALEAKRDALAPGQKIFVNFDPRLFHCPNGCQTCQLIEDLELPRHDVVFEVTENCDPARDRRVQEGLLRCRGKGFRLALDDLGAGYSGLQALLDLKPDYVKLDMSLLAGIDTDPARAGLVRLLVLFARSNGFSLITEGIETAPVLETLLGLGVEYGQGYLIGRPAPVPQPVSPEAMAVIARWADGAGYPSTLTAASTPMADVPVEQCQEHDG